MLKNKIFFNFQSSKTLTNKLSDQFENEIREADLFDSMKIMKNNKTPSNDRLKKEFYKAF